MYIARLHHSSARFAATYVASLSLAVASLALVGCSSGLVSTVAPSVISVTGNWQLSSTAPAAAKVPVLSGELTGAGASITGIFHPSAATTCVSPSTSIELTGSADAQNAITLTGPNFAGGTLTVKGTLASDGRSFSNASYNIVGGSCALAQAVPANAQSYADVTGNYAGGFSDPQGNVLSITSTLSQNPTGDSNGNFLLSGTATLPNNPCFISPVTVSNSQVTGGSFTLTYSDTNTGNSVTGSGTFSTDGTTLTVTNWVLTGPCGPDSGTGLLTKQ
jgi:hypothetical protein